MSKVGQYYMQMQEDAVNRDLEDFVRIYGESHEDFWYEVNFPTEQSQEP